MLILFCLTLISSASNIKCESSPSELYDLKEILFHNEELLNHVFCIYKILSQEMTKERNYLNPEPFRNFSLPNDYCSSYNFLLNSTILSMLQEYMASNDYRYSTTELALRLLLENQGKVLVEIGSPIEMTQNCQTNGCPTAIFSNFAKLTQGHLYSVRFNRNAVKTLNKTFSDLSESVSFIESDSVVYLKKFGNGPIDFLYLDSSDIVDIKRLQEVKVKEIEASFDKLHEKSIILIDDCRAGFKGSCESVRSFLISRGWCLVKSEYQQLYKHCSK